MARPSGIVPFLYPRHGGLTHTRKSASRREPLAGEALAKELGLAGGTDRRFDAALKRHMQRFPKLPEEGEARLYVESLATFLTASVLIRHAPGAVADAYVATRLDGARGRVAGAIGAVDTDAILARLVA